MAVTWAAIPTLCLAQSAPSGDPKAQLFSLLGPLMDNVSMVFSMDQAPNAGITYSRQPAPTGGMLMFDCRITRDEGRQCIDFSNRMAFLGISGLAKMEKNYTLATWAKLPFSASDATVWDGPWGCPLFVKNEQYMCSWKTMEYTFGKYDKSMTGWHHLAVVCDGNTTSLLIDGVILGTVPEAVEASVEQIGRRIRPKDSGSTQCGLLDDMFFFDRALTPTELAVLMPIRLPIQIPLPSTIRNEGSRFATSASALSNEGVSTARELVRTYSNSLVFVTGEGAGSGFMADMGGKPFLLTNAHVAAGVHGAALRTLQGTAIAPGAASVAVGHDIFAMQVPPVPTTTLFSVMRDVEANAAIGDEVAVLGNAEGGGVINNILGHIVGIGPDLVEVDAPFQPGNSGSPMIHLRSKKVIGVATYLTYRKFDPATRMPISNPVIRRFGYRIDSVKTWQPVDWRAFYAQAAELESIDTLTKDLVNFLKDVGDDSAVNPGRHTNPAIRSRIDAWLGSKSKHMSPRDRANVDQNFISFLKVTCQSDIISAQQHLTYDYFRRQLGDRQKERAELAEVFAKILEKVRE